MKQPRLASTKLRSFLLVIVVTLSGLSAGGFYFGQVWLQTFAGTVSQTLANSKASGNDVQSFKKLQANLASRQEIIAKATSLVASSQNYQDQAILDLDKYASNAGISISNFSFAPAAAATAAATTAPASVASTPASSSSSVTITLVSPISYAKLMKFMSAIEGSIPKMQVSSINLGRVADGGQDSVKTDQLTIEVYTQ